MTVISISTLGCDAPEKLDLRSTTHSTEVIELTHSEVQNIIGGFTIPIPQIPQEMPRPQLPPFELPRRFWVR